MDETSEKPAPDPIPGPPPAAAEPVFVDRRLFFAASGVAVLLAFILVVLVVWNRYALHSLDQAAQAERVQMTQAQAKALDTQGREILRLAALPLGWAVRAEMLKDNLQQVDDYFRRFVRERGVESIVLVDRTGKVAVATDRKLEGQAASGLVSAGLLEAIEPTFEERPPAIRLAVPVMGFDSRVGVLILDYTFPGDRPNDHPASGVEPHPKP